MQIGNDRPQRDQEQVNWDRMKMMDSWQRNTAGFEQ